MDSKEFSSFLRQCLLLDLVIVFPDKPFNEFKSSVTLESLESLGRLSGSRFRDSDSVSLR